MKKRLLLLLCLMATAGGAAWAEIASGTCKNGTWKIDVEYARLTVDINGKMADYGDGKAPWYPYADRIRSIHIGSGCKNVGRNAFSGLTLVEEVTGGENVEAVAMYAFEFCGKNKWTYKPIQIYFPKCSYVGECAFAGADFEAISLPLVETYKSCAIAGGYWHFDDYRGMSLWSANIASIVNYNCKVVDLGSKVKKLLAGSVMGPDYVFIQNPDPPTWERRYDYPQDFYDYPFGDNPNVKVIVPQKYLQTYIDYYHDKKDIPKGYMTRYWEPGPHEEWNPQRPTGKFYAGAPIYHDGKFAGWWYVDENLLYVGFFGGTMPVFTKDNVPWKSVLGSVDVMYILGGERDDPFVIPDNAFSLSTNDGLSGIKQVWISNVKSVSIGKRAFEGCYKLEHFVYDWDGEYIPCSLDDYAFHNCYALEDLQYLNVRKLGNGSFERCDMLQNIDKYWKITATNIPDLAFRNCTRLSTPKTMSKVKTIGTQAFWGCPKVKEANLTSVTKLGRQAFRESGVKKVVFGQKAASASWGSEAFTGCADLTDIYASAGISSDTYPSDFFGDVDLGSLTLHASSEVYASGYQGDKLWGKMQVDKVNNYPIIKDGWELSEDHTLTIKSSYLLYYRENSWADGKERPWDVYREFVEKVVVEEDVPFIGPNMFAGLDKLVEVKLDPEVLRIDDQAFKGCSSLKSITLSNVTELRNSVFEDCDNLEVVELGMGLTRIGDYIFRRCYNLKYIGNKDTTPAEVTELTFADIGSQVYQLRGGKPRRAAGQAAVTLQVSDEFVTKFIIDPNWGKFHIKFADSRGTWEHAGPFGDGTWILYDDSTMVVAADKGPGENQEYWSWSALRFNAEVMRKTKRIEFIGNLTYIAGCFQFFENLRTVSLSSSIKTLSGTFAECPKLYDINLDNVTTLGENTFSNTGLTSIDLSNVKYAGRYAFYNCSKLTSAKLGSQCAVGKDVFGRCSALTTVDLGDANLNNANRCFAGCTALTAVRYNGRNLPHGIFASCTALQEVRLGNKVGSIKWSAFDDCTSLNTIYCDNPTPPSLPVEKTRDIIGYEGGGEFPIYGPEYDVQAFHDLSLPNVSLYLYPDYIPVYRRTGVWKNMNIVYDRELYAEPLLPTGGSVGENGTWEIDELGALTIDCKGNMPQSDNLGASTWDWSNTFDRWAVFTEYVRYTDQVTSIAQNVTDNEAELGLYGSVKSVEIGTNVESIGANAMRYTDLTDVYCFAPEPPFIVTSDENGTFDKAAILAKGTTLHVVNFQGTLEKYKKSYRWNWFPKIVADLPTRKPGTIKVERVNVSSPTGTWFSVRSSELGSKTVQLEASVYPSNADNTAVVWTSEDETKATVDANGLVTILGYPDMMEVGITATAADGSNRKGTVSLRIVNPDNDWGSVLCKGMDVDRKIITIMKSQQTPATITVKLEPANSTANIEFDVEDNSLIQVEAEYDNASGRRTGVFHISAPDPMMVPEIQTGSTLIHFYTHYYDEEACNYVQPEVYVSVNVVENVIFTEENVQKVPVTYAVTTLDGRTCTVYGEWVDGHDENGTWVDGGYNTAIDQSTTGLVTVPCKARNYYVTGVDGSAFAECSQLEQVEFESGIKFIGNSAFMGCSNLREVLLPETIEAFGYSSFSNLPNLKDVHILATTPPTGGGIYVGNPWSWPAIGDSYAFDGLTGATLHVPAGCRAAYDVYPWNYWFSSIVEDAADGIEDLKDSKGLRDLKDFRDSWFDLSGRKLAGKPAKPGLYIQGGRKIMVK